MLRAQETETTPFSEPRASIDADAVPLPLIEFRQIPLREALRLFSEQSGLNFAATVQAGEVPISLFLRNVTPRVVLATLAQTHRLVHREDPDTKIITIYTQQEQQQTEDLKQQRIQREKDIEEQRLRAVPMLTLRAQVRSGDDGYAQIQAGSRAYQISANQPFRLVLDNGEVVTAQPIFQGDDNIEIEIADFVRTEVLQFRVAPPPPTQGNSSQNNRARQNQNRPPVGGL